MEEGGEHQSLRECACQRWGEGRAAHLGKMFYLYR